MDLGKIISRGKLSRRSRITLATFAAIAIATLAACKREKPAESTGSTPVPSLRQIQDSAPLSANDVSWLFPAPSNAADLANLIRVRDIVPVSSDPAKPADPVWSDSAFKQFQDIVNGPAAIVSEAKTQISLPAEARSADNWFVAGVRIDAGAPGLTGDIQAQYGRLPEIRLIIQPIGKNADGSPKVFDIAAHLIFDFIDLPKTQPSASGQPNCFPRPVPAGDAFSAVVADAAALRTKLNNGQLAGQAISTVAVPLGVHPGLANPATRNAVRNEMFAVLKKNLSSQRLGSMAIAALPDGKPAPWIFLSILGDHQGHFGPAHGPTLDGTDKQFAQLLTPAGSPVRVIPEPHTNNLNPITCKNAAVSAASLPVAERKGVATSAAFANPAPSDDQVKQILDTIGNVDRSFFFNTDCVSCHTETRLAMDVLKVNAVPGIDSAVLPGGKWDVRNFGWGDTAKGMQPTVTRRAANETAAVVTFINSHR